MATKAAQFIVHPAGGGLDTVTPPTLLPADALVDATNVEFFNPGSRRKRLGTRYYNNIPETDGAGLVVTFRAMADYWRHGNSLTPQQLFVATGGNKVMIPDVNSWQDVYTGWGSNGAHSQVTIAKEYAVISNDLGQVPLKYDRTTVSALCPDEDCVPHFSISTYHLRRLFAAGVAETPSTVYYSAASDITDWIGEDAGSLVLDDGDGDRVVGLSKPFRDCIYIFKGPNTGSIHQISGRTIKQLSRDRISDSAPCVAQQTIVTTPNDIYWLSRYGVHSLIATQKYGNTEEALVSHPIHDIWPLLQTDALHYACGFYHPTRNLVGWFVPEAGNDQNTLGLVYNYALGKWAFWRYPFNVASCMVASEPTEGIAAHGRRRLYLGGYDGIVRSADHEFLVDDETQGITFRIKTPVITKFGDPMNELMEKQFHSVTTFFTSNATDSNYDLNVWVDGRMQTFTRSLQAGGAAWGTAVWGTATWPNVGAEAFDEVSIDDIGRAIQLEYVQTGALQDAHFTGFAVRAVPGETIAMESSGDSA